MIDVLLRRGIALMLIGVTAVSVAVAVISSAMAYQTIRTQSEEVARLQEIARSATREGEGCVALGWEALGARFGYPPMLKADDVP